MLATFIIGLREGLEAALIVGIVAAFLKKNGHRLAPMWIGVVAAVLLSLGVGIGLHAVERALPQKAQEGLETVIGAVAVIFVTGMILWMSAHSRGLKRELEASAQAALGQGTSRALVAMAFLAVLKEGFETAVFLLATFQAAASSTEAAIGAFLGIMVAVVLGLGIYRGGVRLNLSKFFRGTGVFLVLVAAGLVVSALRTAHEAGWLNAGQQRTVDLRWLAPLGSVRQALFTGVLGIPPDPRLVEVIGWLCYLVPLMAIVLWPPARRPGPLASVRIKQVCAGAAVVIAAVLAVAVRTPAAPASTNVPLVDAAGSSAGTARLQDGGTLSVTLGSTTSSYRLQRAADELHDGLTAAHHTLPASAVPSLPTTLTLTQLVALSGGRAPVGVDVRQNPGPYRAAWSGSPAQVQAWTVDGVLLDAASSSNLVLTLSGGGLPTPRTLTISGGAALPGGSSVPQNWTVAPTYVDQVAHDQRTRANDLAESRFWGRFVPVLLILTAAALLLVAARRSRRLGATPTAAASASSAPTTTKNPSATENTSGRDIHAR